MSLSISYSFSPTTTIESSKVNQNFTDVVNYFNNTACVAGMVTMWAGAIGSIPTGWQLCNGSSGAPDLRDKFIIGAGNTYAIGNGGGAATINIAHTHTGPSHTHTVATNGALTQGTGGHSNDDGFDRGAYFTITHNHGGVTGSQGTGNTSSQLSAAQSILPPYFALAFLYKT